ncbi:MAG: hypothetical protein HYZ22_09895 [Chloroflexi bacterium]|nr:hypothetical protein [Chloroflexota bacterium]
MLRDFYFLASLTLRLRSSTFTRRSRVPAHGTGRAAAALSGERVLVPLVVEAQVHNISYFIP